MDDAPTGHTNRLAETMALVSSETLPFETFFEREKAGLFRSEPGPVYHEMRTVPVNGGQSMILFGGDHGGMGEAFFGSMSPDGSLATMTGGKPGGPCCAVFVSNIDGTEKRVIGGYATNPAGNWSPDESRIVIVSNSPGTIKVVDVETGDASAVAHGDGAIWLDDHTLLIDA